MDLLNKVKKNPVNSLSPHKIISNVIISIDLKWMGVGVITAATALIFSRALRRVITAAAPRHKHYSECINYYKMASTKERPRLE